MSYIYENFLWEHCDLEGYKFPRSPRRDVFSLKECFLMSRSSFTQQSGHIIWISGFEVHGSTQAARGSTFFGLHFHISNTPKAFQATVMAPVLSLLTLTLTPETRENSAL